MVHSGGSGSGAVRYRLQANPDARDRMGTITVGGLAFVVHQVGAGVSAPNGFDAGGDGTNTQDTALRAFPGGLGS